MRHGLDPWVGKMPWQKKWQPTPVFLPGRSCGQRSLVGHSPRGLRRARHSWLAKEQPQQLGQGLACLKRSAFHGQPWVQRLLLAWLRPLQDCSRVWSFSYSSLSFPSPFIGIRPAPWSEGSSHLFLLSILLSFTGISPSKSLVHITSSRPSSEDLSQSVFSALAIDRLWLGTWGTLSIEGVKTFS